MKKLLFSMSFAAAIAAAVCGCKKQPSTAMQVDSVEIAPATLQMALGTEEQLTAVIVPQGTGAKVGWMSSDPTVVFVDQNGNVHAEATGRATITARVGEVDGTCVVTVVDKLVESVEVAPASLGIRVGESETLTVKVLPADADDKTIVWKSSAPTVATVDEDGKVTGVALGEAIVTATSANGKEASCTVTVGTMARAGDFFYSDGTYSPTLDGAKTPIGIVFWTGNPAAEDPTLAADHPGCTHGLVVSLDYDLGHWQANRDNYGDHIAGWVTENTDCVAAIDERSVNLITGYNNTKGIEAFNAKPEHADPDGNPQTDDAVTVDIVQRAVAYRTRVPAPANTSDWYVPSLVELALMGIGDFDTYVVYARGTANRDRIIAKLTALGTAAMPMAETDVFWTSTENDLTAQEGVWLFKMYQGMAEPTSSRRSPNLNKTRYVLAF